MKQVRTKIYILGTIELWFLVSTFAEINISLFLLLPLQFATHFRVNEYRGWPAIVVIRRVRGMILFVYPFVILPQYSMPNVISFRSRIRSFGVYYWRLRSKIRFNRISLNRFQIFCRKFFFFCLNYRHALGLIHLILYNMVVGMIIMNSYWQGPVNIGSDAWFSLKMEGAGFEPTTLASKGENSLLTESLNALGSNQFRIC